jgi:hypothetical protein
MVLHFRRWLEDCGPVTKDYANSVDSDSDRPLSYVRSNRMAGQRKDHRKRHNPDKLFGMSAKKKMKK